MNTRAERAPTGLGRGGRKVWREITAEWDLTAAEAALLVEICRTRDRLDYLDRAARETLAQNDLEPYEVATKEARLLQGTYTRMIMALKLPDGRDEEG